MLCNLHTHTTFCDGKNTPEEVVLSAIEKGFDSLGFSGHGHMGFDTTYCMTDTEGYINAVNALKEKYKGKIQIYLGVEEDAYCPANRTDFDYIIGSCHYLPFNGEKYPVDSNPDCFRRCLELYEYDAVRLAHAYYAPFCDYICSRKPDVVGHFDLVTKFDELENALFLENPAYHTVAERYMRQAAASGCLFEVNTGAISRGYRTTPYPQENLLRVLREEECGILLSSDSHSADTLAFGFAEAKALLKDIGFTHTWILKNSVFVKTAL